MADVPAIRIDALDPDAMALWRTVARAARTFDDGRTRWCLVGGLMVALYAIEAGQVARPTTDIDILGDARQRPSATEQLTSLLKSEHGAEHHEIHGLDAEKGFRLLVEGQVVDILASDGLRSPPRTSGQFQTIQIPGGSQALDRSELVEIVVGGERARLWRPTLLAAVLLKVRALLVHSRPEDQRDDLILLLGLMDDPRAQASGLTRTERRWLTNADGALALGDPSLDARVDPARLRIARASWRMLLERLPLR